MEWEELEVGKNKHLIVPKRYSEKGNRGSADKKSSIMTQLFQAELVLAYLIIAWFLINYFYQFGYFMRLGIPLNYLEIDIFLSPDISVLMLYFSLISVVFYNYTIISFMTLKVVKPHEIKFIWTIPFVKMVKRKKIKPYIRINESFSRRTQKILYMVLASFLAFSMYQTTNVSNEFDIVLFIGWLVFWLCACSPSLLLSQMSSTPNELGGLKKSGILLITAFMLISTLSAVPWSLGNTSAETLYKIGYNGKESNQVLMVRYRDYYLVGYYNEKEELYPCSS